MNKRSLYALTVLCILINSIQNISHAQKWADLSMQVVFDGKAPPPIIQRVPGIAAPVLLSEDLMVDAKTNGIANVVFMIDARKTTLTESQFHPDLQEVPKTPAVLEMNLAFSPHAFAIRAGQSVEIRNKGQTGHNAKFSFYKNANANVMLQVGTSKQVDTQFAEPGAVKVESSIHPWMSAYLFVADHPYIGVSDSTGEIKIEKLPAGIELDFKIWHEMQNRSIEEVTLNGKKETWSKGCVKLKLAEGPNELGTLMLKPERFKSR